MGISWRCFIFSPLIIERNAQDNLNNLELLELLEHLEKYTKKRERPKLLRVALLGGGYLRLPLSLAGAVVTLRALYREGQEKRASHYGRRQHAAAIMPAFKRFGGLVWGYIQKNERQHPVRDITSLRGRLPTLPLSQYHRRGEA